MSRPVLPYVVVANPDGKTWRVQRPGGRIIADNLTHSEAWRIWDARDREIARIEESQKRAGYVLGRW